MTPKLRNAARIAASLYTSLAVIVFSTLLLFLAINLVSGLVLQIKAQHEKEKAKEKFGLGAYRDYAEPLERVYPGMTPPQISAVIRQTDRISHRYEPYTQFKEIPLASEYVNVDDRGFRHIKNQGAWPPPRDHLVVFVFGGSTTFGFRVPDEETVPSYLQETLNKHHELPPSKVYNFGRSFYMSSQERILFESLLTKGHVPDVAVFIDGLNELAYPDGKPAHTRRLREFMASGESSPYQRVMREIPFVRLFAGPTERDGIAQSPDSGTAHAGGASETSQALPEWASRYEANKRMIEAVAKAFQVAPVFVWQPVPVFGYDQRYNLFGSFNYDAHMPLLRSGHEFMAKVAESGRLRNDFIWCGGIQEGLKEPLYVDAYHYTGQFARLIASHIAQEMLSRGLVPIPPRLSHGARPGP